MRAVGESTTAGTRHVSLSGTSDATPSTAARRHRTRTSSSTRGTATSRGTPPSRARWSTPRSRGACRRLVRRGSFATNAHLRVRFFGTRYCDGACAARPRHTTMAWHSHSMLRLLIWRPGGLMAKLQPGRPRFGFAGWDRHLQYQGSTPQQGTPQGCTDGTCRSSLGVVRAVTFRQWVSSIMTIHIDET